MKHSLQNRTLVARVRVAWRTLTFILMSLSVASAAEPGLHYELLKSFGLPELQGVSPNGLLEGSDGVLYGAASHTIDPNDMGGVVFALNKDGSGYHVLYRFTGADGTYPGALCEGSDGVLYGIAGGGGNYGVGKVFKLNRDGTGYGGLYDFGSNSFDAQYPDHLFEGTDGALYGFSIEGGAGGRGAVFTINKDGSGYAVLHSFLGRTYADGEGPMDLIDGGDGALYGTTYGGGTNGLVSGGTVFKLSKGDQSYRVLHQFGGRGDVEAPVGLTIGLDGVLYGTSHYGGIRYQQSGALFKMKRDGSDYGVVYRFGAVSNGIPSLLSAGSDGYLYGTALEGNQFLPGVMFRISPDGSAYTTLHTFGSEADGLEPIHFFEGRDGWLYGSATDGGIGNQGTAFKLSRDGSNYAALWRFLGSGGDGQNPRSGVIEASDGALYGVTTDGGTNGFGTVFTVNKDGAGYRVMHHFAEDGIDGGRPMSELVEGSDGALYGSSTEGGPYRAGTIFRIGKDGSYSTLQSGLFPQGPLVEGREGSLYGTTPDSVFRLNHDGSGYTVLHAFHIGVCNEYSAFGLIEGNDGVLYGLTRAFSYPFFSAGTVFGLNKDGSNYRLLRVFGSGTNDLLAPDSRLVEGSDGALYGTTAGGGSNNSGGIFKLNKDGSDFKVLHSFGPLTDYMYSPPAGLFAGSDGVLYGADHYAGLLFSLTSDGSDYAVLHHFSGGPTDGQNPVGRLVQASDGALYGVTYQGGAGSAISEGGFAIGLGAIFRLVVPFGVPQSLSVNEDTPLPVTLSGFEFGAPPLNYSIATPPAHGTLSGSPPNLTYLASTNYNGPDCFTFRATDGESTSAPTAVSITVLPVNDPPIASARVHPLFSILPHQTSLFILAPNNSTAIVVLDGSLSSDVDNDQLQFLWYADSQTNTLATSVVATNQFAIGTHTVTLAVSDGQVTATDQLSFEVITPGTAVGQLAQLVKEASLGQRNEQPLLATLSAAMSAFDRGDTTTALNQLSAFQNKVRAQVALSNPALANELTAALQQISLIVSGR